MMKKLLSSPGSLSWGLFKPEFVLIDFSSGIEDISILGCAGNSAVWKDWQSSSEKGLFLPLGGWT